MKNEDKIKRMVLRTEFDCYGRRAYVDVELTMSTICNTPRFRAALDDSIARFLEQHQPPKEPLDS